MGKGQKNSITNTQLLKYKDGKLSRFCRERTKGKKYTSVKHTQTYIDTGQNY